MKFVVHHFCKEFRYLRLRWLAWLAVLFVQLAVDLEWIVPMRVGVPSPGWIGVLPVLVWGGVVMLALGYAAEDARADDRSFIAVRPLPVGCYWMSRVLVFVLMIGMPMVIGEGVYLLLSRVGMRDVLLGMWECFFFTGAVLAWMLPMPLMVASGARWVIVGVVALLALVLGSLSEQVLRLWQLHAEMFYSESSLAKAAWCGACAMLPLAVLQKRREWALTRTLWSVAGLTVGCFALAWSPLFAPSTWSPREPELMAELEKRHAELQAPHTFRLYASHDSETGAAIAQMDGDLMPLTAPAELLPRWRTTEAVLRQNGQGNHSKVHSLLSHRFFVMIALSLMSNSWLQSSLSNSLPAGTLSLNTAEETQNAFNCGDWPLPTNLDAPADIEARLEADWARQSVLGSCELRPGAVLRSDYADAEVLELHPHVNGEGVTKPGSLTIIFRLQKREIETGGTPFTPGLEVKPMLYAPQQQLLWPNDHGAVGELQMRAMQRGRQRMVRSITYPDVLVPGTGIREADLPTLRFVLRKQDYAGTSRHRLNLKGLDLRQHLEKEPWQYPERNPRVVRNPREGFMREFQRITQPAVDAGPPAVAQFVADVLTLSHALSWRRDVQKDGSPRYPGNDYTIADAVAVHLLRHPQVLTQQPFVFVDQENPFARELLDSTLLLASLPGVTRDAQGLRYDGPDAPNGVPRLLNDMEARVGGWKELAPAIQAALQQRSAAPILAVHEKWRQQMRTVIPDEELLADLAKRFSVSSLRSLKSQSAREKARELIRREYELSVPPAMHPGSNPQPLIECAIASGMEVALDWRLRRLRFLDEKDIDHGDLMNLSMLHRLLGGPDEKLRLTWDEALTFLRRVRELRAADFRYDAAAMTWNPIAKP